MGSHRFAALAASLAAAVAVLLVPVAPAQAAPAVRFTKVYFDSPGSDNGSNSSLNAEWVRVKNFGSRARTLTGWTVRDPQGHVFRFPAFTLRPGGTVTVHTGSGRNTGTHLYWASDGYVWNNDGDRAILKNRAGSKIDACSWSGAGSSVSC